jgi:hypothetical protein
MENDLSTLLPCPFCGVVPRVMLADAQLGHHKIVCGGCRDLNVETLLFLEPSSAIDAWNKRAEAKSLSPVEATGSEAPKSIEPIFEELLWAKYGGGESMTREGFTAALDEFVNQIL